MQKLLSKDEVAGYRDRGYHFPIDALSASEVADFRRKLEDYEAESGGPIKAEMRHRSHVLFTWIDEMVRHPKILDAMEDLLGPEYPVLEHQLLHQGSPRSRLRVLASGRHLLGPQLVRCRDRLDRDVAGQQGFRLHEVHCRHPPAAGPARRHVRPEQPPHPRPGDRGRCRRGQGGLCRVEARPGFAASRAAVPRIGAEPLRRPPHRPRDPLYPDPPEAGGRPARLGDAGARQGYLSTTFNPPMCRSATSSPRRWPFTRKFRKNR